MENKEKQKIFHVAKDINLNSKIVINILTSITGQSYKPSTILSDDEMSLLFDHLTKCTEQSSGTLSLDSIISSERKVNEPELIDNLLSAIGENDESSYQLSQVSKTIGVNKSTLSAILFSYCGIEFSKSDIIEKDTLLYLKAFFLTDDENIDDKISLAVEQYTKFREEKRAEEIAKKIQNPPKPLNVGYYTNDIISFGHYFNDNKNKELPIEWIALDINDESTLLVCNRIISYDTLTENDSFRWIDSKLSKWLNNDFLTQSFTIDEREKMIALETNPIGANECQSMFVSILNYDEFKNHFQILSKETKTRNDEENTDVDVSVGKSKRETIWVKQPSNESIGTYVDLSNGKLKNENNLLAIHGVQPIIKISSNNLFCKVKGSASKQCYDLSRGSLGKWNKLDCACIGDSILLGTSEDGTKLAWDVIQSSPESLLMILSNVVFAHQYHNSFESITWNNSNIRSFLNNNFINSVFTNDELSLLESIDDDKITLLTKEEAQKFFLNSDARLLDVDEINGQLFCDETSQQCAWWLKDVNQDGQAAIVNPDGTIDEFGFDIDSDCIAVRPVIRINPKSIYCEIKNIADITESFVLKHQKDHSLCIASGNVCKKETKSLKAMNGKASYKLGTYYLSEYRKEPLLWNMIAVSGEQALLLCEKVIDCFSFDDNNISTWENTKMFRWLNEKFFYEAFVDSEIEYIKEIAGYSKVFLLSMDEASILFPSNHNRRAIPTQFAKSKFNHFSDKSDNIYWWLRDVSNGKASAVSLNGKILDQGRPMKMANGVRPAIWVDYNSIKDFEVKNVENQVNDDELEEIENTEENKILWNPEDLGSYFVDVFRYRKSLMKMNSDSIDGSKSVSYQVGEQIGYKSASELNLAGLDNEVARIQDNPEIDSDCLFPFDSDMQNGYVDALKKSKEIQKRYSLQDEIEFLLLVFDPQKTIKPFCSDFMIYKYIECDDGTLATKKIRIKCNCMAFIDFEAFYASVIQNHANNVIAFYTGQFEFYKQKFCDIYGEYGIVISEIAADKLTKEILNTIKTSVVLPIALPSEEKKTDKQLEE